MFPQASGAGERDAYCPEVTKRSGCLLGGRGSSVKNTRSTMRLRPSTKRQAPPQPLFISARSFSLFQEVCFEGSVGKTVPHEGRGSASDRSKTDESPGAKPILETPLSILCDVDLNLAPWKADRDTDNVQS